MKSLGGGGEAIQQGVIGVDEALRAKLAEREYLEDTIGTTGLLALRPLQLTSHRDRWHRYLLEQATGTKRQRPLNRGL